MKKIIQLRRRRTYVFVVIDYTIRDLHNLLLGKRIDGFSNTSSLKLFDFGLNLKSIIIYLD